MNSKIFVGITGDKNIDWKNKLKEIEKFKISRVALFLEIFKSKRQRQKIYQALLDSCVKEIPLVHIREDMDKSELEFLSKNFGSRYFTIHETSFRILDKWKGYHKQLFLEMNYDNFVPRIVDVRKIGGFCVDFSHFKTSEQKWSKDFEFVMSKRKSVRFACNHVNGYSYEKNRDIHTVKNLKEFDYLKTLPKFLFGKVIAIETNNSISDQLKFKRYLTKIILQL